MDRKNNSSGRYKRSLIPKNHHINAACFIQYSVSCSKKSGCTFELQGYIDSDDFRGIPYVV